MAYRAILAALVAALGSLPCACEAPVAAPGSAASSVVGQPNSSGPQRPSRADAVRSAAWLAAPTAEPAPAQEPAGTSVRLGFVGDVALALGVATKLDGPDAPPGYPFHQVAERLRGYDLLVGNLECVVATQGQPRVPIPLTAPPSAPARLLDAGFDLVSIANNHSLDRGPVAYREMLARLGEAGLAHIGHTHLDFDRKPWVVRELRGLRIAVIGHYNRDPRLAEADVRLARGEADVVIVFVHWGNEFTPEPTGEQRRMGKLLIEAGAHAVVGAHAHVVQPVEEHLGRPIVHGLGNFVFEGMTRRGTHTGALLELDVDRTGVIARRFLEVALDDGGIPSFVGEPTVEPPPSATGAQTTPQRPE
jgi:poly-gamma-glutamate capsule biosynthesis protein CapA/YwtB (metallophosphatase superfamily)